MKIHIVESIKFDAKQKRRLKQLGEVKYFEGVPSVEELLDRAEGADILCVDWAPIDAAIPRMKPGIKLISVPFTGVGFLPLNEAAGKGIKIANAPGFGTESVGEFGIGLMLALVRGIHTYVKGQPNVEVGPGLYKRTVGILGAGRIGKYVGKVCKSLGMKVIYWTRGMPLTEVLSRSDIVFCALSQSKETEGLLGRKEFDMMKKGSYFVTISPDIIYDRSALLEALDKNLAGAATDLAFITTGDYKSEAWLALKDHPKMLVTPHVAWKTDYAVRKSYDIQIDNVEAFIGGNPINLVN